MTDDSLAKDLPIGAAHYRAFIGPSDKYDVVAAMQFNLLTALGLREEHSLLDIGCGSLRGGRLFISYLLPDRYCGLEPEEWLVEEGLKREIGHELRSIKQPAFVHNREFDFSVFDRHFDYLLAQSILSHTSKAQMRGCLTSARKVMHEDSLFAATYVSGPEDYEGDEWAYPGCCSYTPDFVRELSAACGLGCTPFQWYHPNGQTWVVFTLSGQESKVPALGDASRIAYLESELERARARIQRLEEHPLRKLNRKVRRAIRRRLKR